jgi:hypothetical protein
MLLLLLMLLLLMLILMLLLLLLLLCPVLNDERMYKVSSVFPTTKCAVKQYPPGMISLCST